MAQEITAPNLGKILFVDDEDIMRRLMTRMARQTGVEDLEVFEDAITTVERLSSMEDSVAGVISDGLNGGWKDVVHAARQADIPAVVLSGDDLQEEVEAAGATFVKKPASIDVVKAIFAQFQTPTDTTR